MHSKALILLPVLSLLQFNTAIAKQKDYILPVFTGEWYMRSAVHAGEENVNNVESYINQCFTEEFIFKKKSSDKEGLVLEYMSSLPTPNDCKWKIDDIIENKSTIPSTYLTDDWGEVPNQFYETSYSLACLKKENGYEDIYSTAWVELEPIYNCPDNTRIKHGLSGNHCSYKANLCLADVVGRNMNSESLYWLGHVGLTNSNFYFDEGNTILEVLKPNNNEDVIQENSFNMFVHSSTSFWGSVYEYHSSPTLTFEQANDILLAGINQSLFGAIYVFFAEYREGGMVPKTFFDYFKQKKKP